MPNADTAGFRLWPSSRHERGLHRHLHAALDDICDGGAADRAALAARHETRGALLAAAGVPARAEACGTRPVEADELKARLLVGGLSEVGEVRCLQPELAAKLAARVRLEEGEDSLRALVGAAVLVTARALLGDVV